MKSEKPNVCVLLLFILTLAGALEASALSIAPPRLIVPANVESPIVLQRLKVSVDITSGIALTTLEMEFFNPNRRVLEGELQFPLLDGQQIVGFALDINGKLRDAVAVEKSHGQQVFEDITRRGVDPGLLQATQGNNFKLRVYPIFAQRSRTVVVRYSESILGAGARGVYRLPLDYAANIPDFSITVGVRGSTTRPILTGAGLQGAVFSLGTQGYESRIERRNYMAKGMLEVGIGLPAGARTVTQEHEGKKYFYSEIPVPQRKLARALPSVVGIIWDSSASGVARDHSRELALLDAYFRRMKNGEAHLVRLRESSDSSEKYRIVKGDWTDLRRALESTVYDGATNFGDFKTDAVVREYLLFSDGLGNFGASEFPETKAPVYAINAALQSNPVWLKHVAQRSDGRFIDLLAESPAKAIDKIVFAFDRVRSLSGDGAVQLLVHSPFPSDGKLQVSGVLLGPTARIRLSSNVAGQAPRSLEFTVSDKDNGGTLAATFWARARVSELEQEWSINRAEIQRLGRNFGIVTRETSLIVLELIQDYVRFEVVPPKELLAEYERVRQTLRIAALPTPQQKIERVVALLNERERWWNSDFPKGRIPAPVEERRPIPPIAVEGNVRGSDASQPAQSASPPLFAPAPKLMVKPMAKPAPSPSPAAGAPASTERFADSVSKLSTGSDRSYVQRLRTSEPAQSYRIYLDERPTYQLVPAFYVEVSDILMEKGLPQLALRVLSNLAEIDLENRHLLRTLGNRLMQANQPALALGIFKRVLDISPNEPQSYRDLALAYAAAGDAQRAVDLLYEVVLRPWDSRFPNIELLAVADLNAIVVRSKGALNVSRIDQRILKNMALDIRVVLSWDSDNTDVNLTVTDPNGQAALPGGAATYQGGRSSSNFVAGYGPEEYALRRAKPGRYQVVARFAGQRQQVAGSSGTYAHVRIYENFGSAQQTERRYSVFLRNVFESASIAEIVVPGKAEED